MNNNFLFHCHECQLMCRFNVDTVCVYIYFLLIISFIAIFLLVIKTGMVGSILTVSVYNCTCGAIDSISRRFFICGFKFMSRTTWFCGV